MLFRSSNSQSFLWSFPECPVSIHVNFDFIDRLENKVLALAPPDREVGGLLLGNVLSSNGDIEVSDYFELPSDSQSTTNFALLPDSLANLVQKSAGDRRVIGFYRTHLEQRMNLRAHDLECIQSTFNQPADVFLLIRPHDRGASAGFFFWQDGAVVGGLTFPFSTAALNSPPWTTLMGGSSQRKLRTLVAQGRNRALRLSTGLRTALFVLAATVIALAGVLQIHRVTPGARHTLGLRVERALLGVVVAWNPATPEVANAKNANLLIWDDSSSPAVVRLTTAQLQSGRVFFPSVGDRIEARLDLVGATGKATTESVVSASERAGVRPAGLVATSPAETSEETFREQPREVVPAEAPFNDQPAHFTAAVPIHQVRPDIRSELKPLMQTDNVVEVQVSIGVSGNVAAAHVVRTQGPLAASLSKSAANAALGWKFRPATRNAEPVASKMILEFVFPPSTR